MTGEPTRPSALASVVCGPAVAPSVRVTAVRPSGPVTVDIPLTVPAPVGVHVTEMPEIGLPKPSVTTTTNDSGRVVLTGAVCSWPETRLMPLASSGSAVAVNDVSTGVTPAGTETAALPVI